MKKNKRYFVLIELAALVTNSIVAYQSYCQDGPWFIMVFTVVMAILWLSSIMGGLFGKDLFHLEEIFNDEIKRWEKMDTLVKKLQEEQEAHVR